MSDLPTQSLATDTNVPDTADSPEARRTRDLARLRQVAMKHAVVILVAVTLWGTADLWASITGRLLVQGIAVLDALVVGFVLASLVHEWGHFAGARIAGAVSPVLKETQPFLKSFFMFSFKHEMNNRRQFLIMSAGGMLGNWSLCLLGFMLLPLNTPSQLALLATSIAVAVNVSVFELPIIHRVRMGDDPEQTILNRVQENRGLSSLIGTVVGLALWLAAMLVFR